MRPPFGSRDWFVLAVARKMGYTPVMWSVPLVGDWEYPPADVIAQRVLGNVRDGSIIVLHDGDRGLVCAQQHLAAHVCDRSADIDATRTIVQTLKARGYRFVTIPTLLAAAHLFCSVPGATKRQAVQRTLNGAISTECPSTILRRHADCTLYADRDSFGA